MNSLVEGGLIKDLPDIFDLDIAQLAAIDRMGEVSARKLTENITASKSQPLSRVLTALGVRMTGRSLSRRIASKFLTMDAILNAGSAGLQAVEGIGAERAEVIAAELIELSPVIEALVLAGLNMNEPVVEANSSPLAGKTVVVTGAMAGVLAVYGRNEMNELITRAGGKPSGSVSAKTSILVAGDTTGSKYNKAVELGVTIMTPDEFAILVNDHI